MKKILRASRRVRRGERCSYPAVLFLLCTLFSVLPLAADDYVECTDPIPDEPMDIPGLMENPVNNVDIRFLYAIFIFLEFHQPSNLPSPQNRLTIDRVITSKILQSTVIRI